MSYVDGAFSDRRSKRRALAALGVVAAGSFAWGMVRDLPRESASAPQAYAAAEPGVLMARPIVDLPPEPLLQAATEPQPPPIRRRKAAPQPEPDALGEPVALATVEPAPAVSAAAVSVDAAAVQPYVAPPIKEPRR